MKIFSLFLFSFVFLHSEDALASSCCVSNTSVSNLMILPSRWQETFSLSQSRVIGDVNEKGSSVFRRDNNRDILNLAKLDLAYGWSPRYQSGLSLTYQGRSRDLNGESSESSGWSDIGLWQAYQIISSKRLWVFNSLNIPTGRSIYNTQSSLGVDARGSGTYQVGLGIFAIRNLKEWDFISSSEIHHSLGRTFNEDGIETRASSFWGASLSGGVGYIPWRSKARYGLGLTPRYEEPKNVRVNKTRVDGKSSLVWDLSINYSYTINSQHSLGLSYIDQTIFGPARNTVLSRLVIFQWQTKWER